MMNKYFLLLAALFLLQTSQAQQKSKTKSTAVVGDLKQKNLFYMGVTGGGVWKTQDGGNNWKNISDKYFGGTIGAVAIAPSDENIIYVGEGENTMRGNEIG